MKPPVNIATVSIFVICGAVLQIRTRSNLTTNNYFSEVNRSIRSSVAEERNDKARSNPFRWDSVADQGLCGSDKCFFRDLDDDSIGYLVSRNKRSDDDQDYVLQIDEGYKLACYLQQAHGIEHFLAGPPFSVSVNSTLLRAHLSNRHPQKAQQEMYTDKFPAVVQMVRVAPSHVMFFKSNTDNSSITQNLEIMWKTNHKSSRFVERISRDAKRTLDILYSIPLLANDFQIMMDPYSGAIYHFDFDRFVAGIFHRSFDETFPNKHANAVRAMKSAVDWANNKAQRRQVFRKVGTNQAEYDDFSILRYENSSTTKCTEEAAIYVDSHFRWKGRKIHNLARNMLLDYVQKRWHYMHQNKNMTHCPSLR